MDQLNQPVVIDQGSGTLKAGFAGSDHPSCYFPNYVGQFPSLLLLLTELGNDGADAKR